jgi:hypothetical protein
MEFQAGPPHEPHSRASEIFLLRATLVVTVGLLLIALWAAWDAHTGSEKIAAALQAKQEALDASQAENAALSSVSLESFLQKYNAHVAALSTAVEAYEMAAKHAATNNDADGTLATARNDLYAATDDFTHFIDLWRAVAEPFNKLLDGNVTALENSKREDNAADVSAAAQRIVRSASDLATPLRVALDKLKPASK